MAEVSFNEAINFSRASTGTYWGPDGNLHTAAVDEPRFDHDPVTGEPLGVLIEESRTNLITSSEQVGLLGRAEGTSTHETETGVLPPISGVTEVSKVTPTAGRSNFYQYGTNMPGSDGVTPVTRSFFIKPGPGCDRISSSTSRTNGWYSRYDVSTGDVVLGGNAESATVVPVGEGWLRYTVTSLSTDRMFLIEGFSSTSDPTAHFYYTGLQAEEGPAATSYIPTIDSPVTRAADEVYRTLGEEFNPDEGTLRITAQVPEGEVVASLGDLEIVSDDGEMKTYVLSYDEAIVGDTLELGRGVFQSIEYFPRVIP